MKEYKCTLENINLKGFLKESIAAGKKIMSVPAFLVDDISKFDFDECFDEYEEASVEEIYNEFLTGKHLFVLFSDGGVNYPDVACIDGEVYQTIDEMEEEEYFDEEGAPEGFVFTNKLRLGETSSIGYLLTYADGAVTIQSAQFYLDATGGLGPNSFAHLIRYSAIELREDVEVFEQPLEDYLKRFV